jgi:type IV pilus assembly protein PilY1
VIVADTGNHRIVVLDSDGRFIRQWGRYGTGDGQFRYPFGVNTDSAGNVYVGDTGNRRVQIFDSSGNFLRQIGGNNITRFTEAIKVVKKIVSNSDLNQGANFGLMTWATNATMRVNVSPNGASQIYDLLTNNASSIAIGGATYIHRAMELAQRYMNGPSSPITSSCQKNLLVVIGDGDFNGNVNRGLSLARTLAAKTPAVKTFVVGFHYTGSSYYTQLAAAGGTSEYSPVYADNPQQLYDALAKIIRAEVGGRLTFSAPVVAFDQVGDDYLLQPSFIYQKEHQWEGSLKKYEIKGDGAIGAEVWNAGKKLKDKSASDRKIWTVGSGIPSGINNFTTSNANYIHGLLYEGSGTNPSDEDRDNLIKFVRGIDVYGEADDKKYGTERWKLGDIYHSVPFVIGPPSANTTSKQSLIHTEAYYRYENDYDKFIQGNSCGGSCPSRKKTILVGANDGMLHAFDFETGAEKWAFIPPMVLPHLRQMIATKSNTSNSIYGVDGSPVVKDIYYDNRWKTVLVGGLGAGGYGMYALDITNVSSPSFLFAFSNDPSDKMARYWDSDGIRREYAYDVGIPSEYDYSELGETWATPHILAMPHNGKTKWVAVFGAGYNSGVNTDYGSAVYVIDLEDGGKVLKKISLTDNSGGVANSVPAELTLITPDSTSKATYAGAMAYVADLESKFWKINLSNTGALYDKAPLFDAEADTSNTRYAFHRVAASVRDDDLWFYYGTGNWQKLQQTSSSIDNRLYAVKDTQHPLFEKVNLSKNNDLKDVSNSSNDICPSQTDLGWFFKLDKNEKVTGKVAVGDGKIYVPRYTPNSTDVCKVGTSKVTAHEMLCGKKKDTIELGEGIVTGLTYYRDKSTLYGGLSATQNLEKALVPKDGSTSEDKTVWSKKIDASETSSKPSTIKIESWREIF